MRAWPLLLCAMACASPDDLLTVSGSGPGASKLELLREPESTGRLLTCDAPVAYREGALDADGGFDFLLARAEIERFTGAGQVCLRAAAEFPSGARAHVDSRRLIASTIRLPPLVDWDAGFSVGPDLALSYAPAGRVEPKPCVTPPRQQGGFGSFERVETHSPVHRVTVTTGGKTAWVGFDAGTLDPELLEDFDAEVTLSAAQLQCGHLEAGIPPRGFERIFPVFFDAPERVHVQGTRVPVSRGAPCRGFDAGCPWTDGKLDPVDAPIGMRQLVFTLASPTVVRTVVLRGVENGLDESITVSGRQVAIDPITPWPADPEYDTLRYYRLSLPASPASATWTVQLGEGLSIGTLTEVSLWE